MPQKSPPSHPTGIVVDIVGTEETSQGRTCDDGKTACVTEICPSRRVGRFKAPC